MAQAAAEEKSESAVAASAPSSGGGASKLVMILTGVNLLATLGMVGVLFISFQKERKKPAVEDIAAHAGEEAKAGEGKAGEHGEAKAGEHGAVQAKGARKTVDYGRMITLDQFTVNLSAPGSATAKYVRVNIS